MTEMSGFVQTKSFFRLDTDLKKRRYVGSVAALVLLILFLGFNRIPKLDTVEADLAIATSPIAQCFQGFCIENVDDSTLWDRWWNFSLTYLNLVSIGMVFAFMMAGITESFIFPRNTEERFRGHGFSGVLKGAVIGPVMALCSACIVPVATAFRRRGAGIEATVAITQGSSTMNLPALIMASMVFIPLIGGSRIALSVLGTLLLGPIVASVVKTVKQNTLKIESSRVESKPDGITWRESLFTSSIQFLRATVRQALRLGPVMVIAGFASGLAIQWVSPQTVTTWIGDDILGILVAATLGILINVPLMFEIPLVAAMLLAGMGTAPAGALLFTAAAGGPITYWGLSKVIPVKGVATLAISTWALGVIGGTLLLAITSIIEEDREFSFRADYSVETHSAVLLPPPRSEAEKKISVFWEGSEGRRQESSNLNSELIESTERLIKERDFSNEFKDLSQSQAAPRQIVLRLHIPSDESRSSTDDKIGPKIVVSVDYYQSHSLVDLGEQLPIAGQDLGDGEWMYRIDLEEGAVVKNLVISWPSGVEQRIFEPSTSRPVVVVHDPSKF